MVASNQRVPGVEAAKRPSSTARVEGNSFTGRPSSFTPGRLADAVSVSPRGELLSALARFKDLLENFESVDDSRKIIVSDGAVAQATLDGDTPRLGRFHLSVERVASGQVLVSKPFDGPDFDLGSGALTFAMPSGASFKVALRGTVEQARDAINAAKGNFGVEAALIEDPLGTRLELRGLRTGKDAAFTIAVIGRNAKGAATGITSLNFQNGLFHMRRLEDAANAEFKVDGESLSSQSNTVLSAIKGVKLELNATGRADVFVTRDTPVQTLSLDSFISAYNHLLDTTSRVAARGESSARLRENLFAALQTPQAGRVATENRWSELQALGVTVHADGLLALPESDSPTANLSRGANAQSFAQTGAALVKRMNSVMSDALAAYGAVPRDGVSYIASEAQPGSQNYHQQQQVARLHAWVRALGS